MNCITGSMFLPKCFAARRAGLKEAGLRSTANHPDSFLITGCLDKILVRRLNSVCRHKP